MQPELRTRGLRLIDIDGLRFKDHNGNGRLDPYEDWRRPASERARDLLGRMSLEEKAGASAASLGAERRLWAWPAVGSAARAVGAGRRVGGANWRRPPSRACRPAPTPGGARGWSRSSSSGAAMARQAGEHPPEPLSLG